MADPNDSADFDSDAEINPRNPFNSSIKKILMDSGYLSYDFLPPVDDSAWRSEMLQVLTEPMAEYVKNRLRMRSARLAGNLTSIPPSSPGVCVCCCRCISFVIFYKRNKLVYTTLVM